MVTVKKSETETGGGKQPANYYINKKVFLQQVREYLAAVEKAKAEKTKKPPVPEDIALSFVEIATRISHRYNFVDYIFRDDMISDAVENCLMCVENFDPEKSTNPFGYFTQVIYHSFMRTIKKEKRYLYGKFKVIQSDLIHSEDLLTDRYGSAETHEFMLKFVDDYERRNGMKQEESEKSPQEPAKLTKGVARFLKSGD